MIIFIDVERAAESEKEGSLKSKNQQFTYSEIVHITNNFKTIIGEGGFGKVYLGTLNDDSDVAVKVLSPSSRQGYKEFRAEAQLLMVVHHRNLVSLIGYCDDRENKALIYEYMVNGNLQQHLSETTNMVDGQPLVLVTKLCLVLVPVIISAVSNSKLVAAHDDQAKRKLEADANASGFISIDCGATEGHRDNCTGLFYETDTKYVDTGEVHEISPYFTYDDVCLVNTGFGVPYISVLELRPLNNSIYLLKDGALRPLGRYDVGAKNDIITRYPEDVYDRIWCPRFDRLIQISTESKINTESFGDAYQVPDRVLRTASRTQNACIPLILPFNPPDSASLCYIYFHFAEIEKLKDGQKRKLRVDLCGETGLKVTEPITLEYLKPMILTSTDLPISGTKLQFSINATGGSDLPPILNAVEIFMFVGLPLSPTNLNDGKFSSF
ncbi:hypothetical protein LWI29_002465 [Acer saccharum]|uniref:Protein kinase domain-containing protein n=1 Tax=Acer saccharum TaxID=4024 RepID=A0AA39SQJ4_ACESA|nr:hypothetical protein LWI29_002465 [Acer saccharum]